VIATLLRRFAVSTATGNERSGSDQSSCAGRSLCGNGGEHDGYEVLTVNALTVLSKGIASCKIFHL
jgi:hypothetical protein